MKPITKFWFDDDEQRLYMTSTIPETVNSEDAGTTETYTIDKKGFTFIDSDGKKHHTNLSDFQFAMLDYMLECV